MANKNLHKAKAKKNDEFYTMLTDIEKELMHYRPHLKNKVIFCNCDDPVESNFWLYFKLNFEFLGLKKLISTHYSEEHSTYKLEFDGVNTIKTELEGNGDFRSPEAINILEESDIVITNPPFSLFREYVAQLINYKKDFLIIGSFNAITYKEIFPLIKTNKLWLGISPRSMKFQTPSKDIKLVNTIWYTNLEHSKRNEKIISYKEYSEVEFPKYDNYDAINIDKVKDIPKNYLGIMGVPITFLTKYNPEQFEILGITSGRDEFGIKPTKRYIKAKQINLDNSISNGSKANTRATLLLDKLPNKIYYIADNAKKPFKILYARILIRRKETI